MSAAGFDPGLGVGVGGAGGPLIPDASAVSRAVATAGAGPNAGTGAVAPRTPVVQSDLESPRTSSTAARYTRVARNSEPTFIYDAKGTYPAMRLFQIARPLPPPRPFGTLPVSEESPGLRRRQSAAYARRGENPPSVFDRRL